eukprot:scaffold2510_cov17-Tisochrysis_lutea.AAC.1
MGSPPAYEMSNVWGKQGWKLRLDQGEGTATGLAFGFSKQRLSRHLLEYVPDCSPPVPLSLQVFLRTCPAEASHRDLSATCKAWGGFQVRGCVTSAAAQLVKWFGTSSLKVFRLSHALGSKALILQAPMLLCYRLQCSLASGSNATVLQAPMQPCFGLRCNHAVGFNVTMFNMLRCIHALGSNVTMLQMLQHDHASGSNVTMLQASMQVC